jgi:hypothetical protein
MSIHKSTVRTAGVRRGTDATLLKGQRAWHILGRPEDLTTRVWRKLWKQVGAALLEGWKEHPRDRAFDKWCVSLGFTMPHHMREISMKLATKE